MSQTQVTYTPNITDKPWGYASREIEEALDRLRLRLDEIAARTGLRATLVVMDESIDIGDAEAIDFAGDAVSAGFDTTSKIAQITITALTHPQVMSRVSLRF